MVEPRIVVVGAGPAGVRCAEALVAAGLRPTVIDEGRRAGGQIYRRQPENFTRPYAKLYGTETQRAEAIHRTFDDLAPRIDYRPETLAWNVADGRVWTAAAGRQEAIAFDALIVCAGAIDRLMPVKGWNLAGAYSLGAAQIALKAQACAVGRRVALMGSGPLLYLLASQYLQAGAALAAVLDTSPAWRRVAALPKLAAEPGVLWNGVVLTFALRRAGVPAFSGVQPIEIEGEPQTGVQAVSFRDARGRIRRIECDAVAMGYHLRPETQLADLARCDFRFDAGSRQWVVERDACGRTSTPGVYLAGDGAYVLGARAAEASGRLAALAALQDLGRSIDSLEMAGLRRQLDRWDRFAQGLREAFPWPAEQAAALPDDAIVCRCESVTAGELRRVVREAGACEANRAKAFSRVGMGRCQGRYCGHAGAEVIAAAAGVPLEQVGRLRGQAPVKPLPVALEEAAP
jgi:NADPH-dependent 2,4-dienoyl-CoA reductase/sulfur reductase-like enzyme